MSDILPYMCEFGFMLLVFGIIVGITLSRQWAVDAGVAEWVIDKNTGEKDFRFKVDLGDDK